MVEMAPLEQHEAHQLPPQTESLGVLGALGSLTSFCNTVTVLMQVLTLNPTQFVLLLCFNSHTSYGLSLK